MPVTVGKLSAFSIWNLLSNKGGECWGRPFIDPPLNVRHFNKENFKNAFLTNLVEANHYQIKYTTRVHYSEMCQ